MRRSAMNYNYPILKVDLDLSKENVVINDKQKKVSPKNITFLYERIKQLQYKSHHTR